MLTLHELQKQFIDRLDHINENINASIITPQHFSIYQNSIVGALQKALIDIYPVCYKLVGHDYLVAIIIEYVAITPSSNPNIAEYGSTFADFLGNFREISDISYLSDVAALEWAWHQISDAPENPTLDFEKLSACYATHGENIIFHLPPKSSLLVSKFPIHDIWEMNQEDYRGDKKITLKNNEEYFFLVWRNQSILRIDILSRTEWQILSWMQQQFTLGEIAEKIETDFSATLLKLVAQGWICDFYIK
jgi:hypothetical protein